MKQIVPFRFFFFFSFISVISNINANGQVVQPAKSTKAPNVITDKKEPSADSSQYRIAEKLVALALNGPRYKGAEHQNKINEYQLKRAKNSWLNILSLSVNYNDQTFAAKSTQSTYVYPKYFFGLNIPLGTLFSRTEVKAAKEQVATSKEQQEQLARTIRSEVLSKYYQYLTYNDLITNQNRIIDDESGALLQAEQEFRKGSISLTLYNAASRGYNDEVTKRINLQLQQLLMKLAIEEMIGVPFESVTDK